MRMQYAFLTLILTFFLSFAHAVPNWMTSQIQEDLASYQENKILRSKVLEVFNQAQAPSEQKLLVLFELKDGKLSATPDKQVTANHHAFQSYVQSVQRLIDGADLPDLIFILTLHDGWTGSLSVPIFAPCAHTDFPGTICFPDFEALGLRYPLKDVVKKSEVRWKKKITKAFWRGSTTGACFTRSNCYDIPRSRLVIQSLQYPRLLNARFVNYCQFEEPSFIAEFQKKCPSSPPVSVPRHLRYRYLIDVDGNASSWSRVYWILLSHSVLLKQASPWYQWYYKAIKPWVHYIPLAHDVSDIKDKIIWAKRNDGKAHKIAQNATNIVEGIFSEEAIRTYIVQLLKSYAACLDNDN